MRSFRKKYPSPRLCFLKDPIYCGFLLKFCEMQYNSENMHFVMSVNSFRDGILALDNVTWSGSSWKELDKIHLDPLSRKESTGVTLVDFYLLALDLIDLIDYIMTESTLTQPETDDSDIAWISPLNRLVVKTQIQRLWDSYLCHESETQICVPAKAFHNTKKRMVTLISMESTRHEIDMQLLSLSIYIGSLPRLWSGCFC